MSFTLPAEPEAVERTVAALRDNGFVVHVVDTPEEARKLVAELLPADQTVFTAASETLRLSGIYDDVNASGASLRDQVEVDPDDIHARIRLGVVVDVIVGSVHAVTEQGHLVAVSASGSQLAAYAAGAKSAVWVVGSQKLVPDLETALTRVRTHSLPLEDARQKELNDAYSFIGRILILEREYLPNRGTVVLIREPIGF